VAKVTVEKRFPALHGGGTRRSLENWRKGRRIRRTEWGKFNKKRTVWGGEHLSKGESITFLRSSFGGGKKKRVPCLRKGGKEDFMNLGLLHGIAINGEGDLPPMASVTPAAVGMLVETKSQKGSTGEGGSLHQRRQGGGGSFKREDFGTESESRFVLEVLKFMGGLVPTHWEKQNAVDTYH